MNVTASSMLAIAAVSVTSKQILSGGTCASRISSMMKAWKPGLANDWPDRLMQKTGSTSAMVAQHDPMALRVLCTTQRSTMGIIW